MRGRLLTLAAWCALLVSPAAASPQQVSLDALAGAWVFETDPHALSHCVIRGEVEAARTRADLRMNMRVHETCPNRNEWRAEEACAARLAENILSVRCVVVSATPDNYVADQFSLRVLSVRAMSGRLADGVNWDGAVHWRRPQPGLVS
jgi:hypothetical protein